MVSCRLKRLSKGSISEFKNKIRNIDIGDKISLSFANFLLQKKKFVKLGVYLDFKKDLKLNFNKMFSVGNISKKEYQRFFLRNHDPFGQHYQYTLDQIKFILEDCNYQNSNLSLAKVFYSLKVEDRSYTYEDFKFIFNRGFLFDQAEMMKVIGKEKIYFSNFIIKYAVKEGHEIMFLSRKIFLRTLRLKKEEIPFSFNFLEKLFDLCQFNIENLFHIIPRYFEYFVGNTCDKIITEMVLEWIYSNHKKASYYEDSYFITKTFYLDDFITKARNGMIKSNSYSEKDIIDYASMLYKAGYNSVILENTYKNDVVQTVKNALIYATIGMSIALCAFNF